MLGIPAHPGAIGYGLLLLGTLIMAFEWRVLRRRPQGDAGDRAAALVTAAVVAIAPYVGWRVVEDLRVTTGMTSYERAVSGPVQAYLQPYLLDSVRAIIPPGATYATVVGPGVRFGAAAQAFPVTRAASSFPARLQAR